MRIWFDCTNTPHVHVILPLITHLKKNHEIIVTARNFSETIPQLEKNGVNPIIIGSYRGSNKINKGIGLAIRTVQLQRKLPDFDLSFSLGGNYTATVSHIRKKPSIVFSDNDISFKYLAYRFGTEFVLPEYFNLTKLKKYSRIEEPHIHTFRGYKEDIYLAGYNPDTDFLKKLPFHDFITIRPENLQASYIPKSAKSIVPELFRAFQGENILFLPRFDVEKKYAIGFSNVFIPGESLNGLDVCFYSKAVLTGAGTFAREAALLGTPAVSFFPGKKTLSVDKKLRDEGKQFFSRDPMEILGYLQNANKKPDELNRSKDVMMKVLSIIDSVILKYSA